MALYILTDVVGGADIAPNESSRPSKSNKKDAGNDTYGIYTSRDRFL